MNLLEKSLRSIRDFTADSRAAVTVELVLVVPLLIWAFFATMIFNDAYRARTQAQAAALHIADAISRTTTIVDDAYLEGMNDVYDFLIADSQTSRLRITSVVWDRDTDQPLVLWSYGTRGMNALPDNTFQLMSAGDMGALRELMDGEDGTDLVAGFTQMPNNDLHNRIPPVMPGEALILVESFTMWETPLRGVFLGFDILENTRLSPIAVVRPRFSPFINYEGAMDAAPPDADEFDGTPPAPVTDPDADPVDPDDPADPVDVVSTDFTSGANPGWSSTQTTQAVNNGSGSSNVGTYLGPFGNETRRAPLTFTNTFSQDMTEATYEFGLVLFGSWDGYSPDWSHPEGESMILSVNDEVFAFEVFAHRPWGLHQRDRSHDLNTSEVRVRTRMSLENGDIDLDGNGWADQIWRLTVQVFAPTPTVSIGFAANTNEPTSNEGFGISYMRLAATPGQPTPPRWLADASTRLGVDNLTGFGVQDGCFEPNDPAQGLMLGNSDLWGGPIRMTRNVGGDTSLRDCRSDGLGFFDASPLMVLKYENDTGNWANNRLRIRTDDGADGFDCDATLLIRDPNDQWQFVDDLAGFGWNAGLELAHAQSGNYTIWAGRFGRGTCETQIVFEHY